jgi:hypothetical protein
MAIEADIAIVNEKYNTYLLVEDCIQQSIG